MREWSHKVAALRELWCWFGLLFGSYWNPKWYNKMWCYVYYMFYNL